MSRKQSYEPPFVPTPDEIEAMKLEIRREWQKQPETRGFWQPYAKRVHRVHGLRKINQ